MTTIGKETLGAGSATSSLALVLVLVLGLCGIGAIGCSADDPEEGIYAALAESKTAARAEFGHAGGQSGGVRLAGRDVRPRHGRGAPCFGHGSGGFSGLGGRGGAMGGMAGAPAPTPMGCQGMPPASPVIANFADAVAGPPITFGTAPNITGGTFSYAAPGLIAPALSLVPTSAGVSQPGLNVVSNPGPASDSTNTWFGFGLYFDSCVDASAYNAVKFTLTGDLGNCAIRYATTYSQNVSPADDPRGSCAGPTCFPPSLPLTTTGTTIVDFAATLGGSPGIIDPRSIIGVQWQMDTPVGVACGANFTISDISFVTR